MSSAKREDAILAKNYDLNHFNIEGGEKKLSQLDDANLLQKSHLFDEEAANIDDILM